MRLHQRSRTAHQDWKGAALPTPAECLANAKRQRRLVTGQWGTEVNTRRAGTGSTYHQGGCPTTRELPVEAAPVKEMDVHQHIAYEGETYYPMAYAKNRSRECGGRTPADKVVHNRTKVVNKQLVGKKLEEITSRRKWRKAKDTEKVMAKRAKAQAWMAKHGGKVKVR